MAEITIDGRESNWKAQVEAAVQAGHGVTLYPSPSEDFYFVTRCMIVDPQSGQRRTFERVHRGNISPCPCPSIYIPDGFADCLEGESCTGTKYRGSRGLTREMVRRAYQACAGKARGAWPRGTENWHQNVPVIQEAMILAGRGSELARGGRTASAADLRSQPRIVGGAFSSEGGLMARAPSPPSGDSEAVLTEKGGFPWWLLLLAAAGGGYWYYKRQQKKGRRR